jgi:hypothetical protein
MKHTPTKKAYAPRKKKRRKTSVKERTLLQTVYKRLCEKASD